MRQSLDIRSWEAAQKLVCDWEIQGKKPVTMNEAADRFLTDRESAGLGTAQLGKYKNVVNELGSMPLRNVTVDDIRRIKETWKLSPISIPETPGARTEVLCILRRFGVARTQSRETVKLPPARYDPTMPFTG